MEQLYQGLLLLLVSLCVAAAEKRCPRGHHLLSPSSSQEICAPCQDGSFMSEDDHINRKCLACAKVDNPGLEVLVTACNRTHDTEILCQSGYYRYQARAAKDKDRCVVCSQCQFLVRSCQGNFDTVCCHTGESCVSGDHTNNSGNGEGESLGQDARNQVDVFSDLLTTDRENGISCGRGFYTYTNISNGQVTCNPCIAIVSSDSATSDSPDGADATHLPVECRTKSDLNTAHVEFRIVSILLFSVAVLVDSIYVFLYSRNFLRKYTGHASSRSCFRVNESRSRIIGTAGIDVHILFICIHLFGILCEVSVVNMHEAVLWRFTVAVGVLTIILYFLDAVLFLFVKRVICAHVCVSYRLQNINNSASFSTEDAQVFLDNT